MHITEVFLNMQSEPTNHASECRHKKCVSFPVTHFISIYSYEGKQTKCIYEYISVLLTKVAMILSCYFEHYNLIAKFDQLIIFLKILLM